MLRLLFFSLLTLLLFLTACNSVLDDNTDIAVIVNETEITRGELGFLYGKENIADSIDWFIKVELAKQEVEGMGLNISPNVEHTVSLPSKDTTNKAEKEIRQFAQSQAQEFGMDPEEYYAEFARKTSEQTAYIQAYVREILGEIEESTDERKYIEDVDKLLEELVENNTGNIEILIE